MGSRQQTVVLSEHGYASARVSLADIPVFIEDRDTFCAFRTVQLHGGAAPVTGLSEKLTVKF
jgi:hypothetical protein